MNTEEVIEQRRLVRIGKQQSDDRLVNLHRKAVEVLLNKQDGERVLRLALERVEKWDSEQLCNSRYIKTWRAYSICPLPPCVNPPSRTTPMGLRCGKSHRSAFCKKQAIYVKT